MKIFTYRFDALYSVVQLLT